MSAYKSGLSATGPSFEKTKLQMRRPTPDSDVLASSDDDHEHAPANKQGPGSLYAGGRRPSSGWLQDIQPNRKFSLPSGMLTGTGSQPTTPSLELPQASHSRPSTAAFPWNLNNPFSASQSNSRLKEVLPSPTSAVAPGDRALPSPTNLEPDEGIGHLLNQQNAVRKSVRSQSYSVGQQDIENSPIGQFSSRMRGSVRNRPSKTGLRGESLAQLREDDIDEVESSNGSEQGVRLPPGYWEREREHKQALLKQVAVENARARHRAMSTSSPISQQRRKTTVGLRTMTRADSDYAVDELDDTEHTMDVPNPSLTRRFSEHVAASGREPEVDQLVDGSKKTQWSTSAGYPLQDALGRRHSFATYSTHSQTFQHPRLSNTYEEEDEDDGALDQQQSQSPAPPEQFDASAYFRGYGPASRALNASAISAAHPDPIMPLPSAIPSNTNPYSVPQVLGRPGRRLFVVSFKCSRADIYYLYDNTGLEIRRGDLVMVEGDRGCDLGQVTHADYQADYHKLTYYYFADAYVNFNELVTDLFKQYKVRIWMSAVNPASVVNPAGIMQVPPPSAIGPGAIVHSSTPNASLSVGPGFGNSSFRANEQYGGRTGTTGPQGHYDESNYAFSHQLPGYPPQQPYGMPQWPQAQPEMYGRYTGSPMNYGAFYPPTTYSASPAFNNASSGPSYRGGYPAGISTSTNYQQGYSGGSSSTQSYNGYTATSAAGYDPAYLLSAMQSMNVGK
ncbi:hypothetical protein EJ04DRAFT_286750 [Polyplosphaeria fusca]|uniref:PSP1 C-terminal domain-containing protein n=1 Tax=Polyplosphaeria fusca TaxID=682080 RepID=A0A9P4V8N1_9PLEO|nr:hypothetical protein EJ04DRAFT_286750 [Polyplosphaeria fusca]